VGEGHDKGGVESRGKAIRLQHLAPVPRGDNLTAIAQTLITDLERAFAVRCNLEGQRLSELWAEERPQLLRQAAKHDPQWDGCLCPLALVSAD